VPPILREGTDAKLLVDDFDSLTILGGSKHSSDTSCSGILCLAGRAQLDIILRRTCCGDGDDWNEGDDNLPICPGDGDDGKTGDSSCPKGDAKPHSLFEYWEKDDPGLLDKIGDRIDIFLKVVISGVAGTANPKAEVCTGNLCGAIVKSGIVFLIGVVAPK